MTTRDAERHPFHAVPDRVRERAAAAPGATAIVAADGSEMSYGALAARARRLGGRLAARGVGRGDTVAVLAGRTPEMVAALLAVWEAGAAYLPLDPATPAERVATLLADAGARVLLVDRDGVAVPPDVEALRLDLAAAGDGEEPPPAPDLELHPEDLAYVIFTSGSTGRPKGVEIPHRGVANLVDWHLAAYGLGPADRSGCVAGLGFDAAVWELWPALAAGAAVCLVDEARRVDPQALVGWLAERRVDVAFLPTPLAEAALALPWPADAPLRWLLTGGDVLHRHPPAGLPLRLVNHYGPTEASVVASAGEVAPGGAGLPDIGRAIDGAGLLVLDGAMAPVAPGEEGDLYVGGAGLARGYAGRPGWTAERFVPDPAGGGGRLYATGDRARLRGDGRLDFLGRRDGQVKVRGVRIELGEIEAALAAEPEVAAAVAEAPAAAGGERRLVAWWQPAPGAPELDEEELRARLARRLPEAMLPQRLVRLDRLPLTANGKVDRRALPDPGAGRPDLHTAYAAPENERQRRIAELWSEVVGVERVGLDDEWIALGGHSLAAARVAARLRDAERVDLAVVDVFAHPTVRALAARVEELAAGADRLPPLVAGPRPESIPLSFQQEQVWFLQRLAPEMIAYNFQCTLRLRGRLDLDALERALAEIVRRHEVLRTEFVDTPQGAEQRVRAPWRPRVERVDLGHLPAERREAAAEELVPELVRRRFDVGTLPLVAWTAIALAPDDHLLVQVEHHFVHDGWSLSVFLRELTVLYDAFVAGRPSPLPELPVQYADLALWQRRALAGDFLDAQLAHWRRRLAEPPPPLDLPTDRPRPAKQSFRGAAIDEELPPALYRELRRLARSEGVTLYVTLLAAFQALVARLTARRRFLLGAGIANRRTAASEGLIGMIVNTVALTADLEGDPTFRELLARVRREVLDAQAHPDLPLERLVAALQPERDLSRNPLFQVMFSFHDAPVPDLDFGGLSGRLLERHNGSAKVDLNVIARPRAEQRIGRAAAAEDGVVRVLWEYSTDLFDRQTVEALWRRWVAVLAAVVAAPSLRVSELPLVEDDERRRLAAWNDTVRPYPRQAAVHDLVLAAARRRPQAAAVVWDGGSLSYGELAERSEAVARRLVARGVGGERRVGLAFARGPEMIVATLAVLRAGGAYLPLDPDYPADRLAHLVADGGAALVLADAASAGALPAGTPVVGLDELLAGPASTAPLPRVPADALAYVMYTSGSTGTPKGVAATHRNVVRLVAGNDFARLDEGETLLQAAPTAFDAATFEIWGALVHGGRLALLPPGRVSVEELGAAVERFGVTTMWLTAGLFQQAVDAVLPSLRGVRQLLAGGDVLSPAHVDRALDELPATAVINGYGPTENTTFTACHRARGGESPVPIGRPIANTTAWIVDRRLRPMPPGAVGELCAGGDGVARGYLGRPAATAERFVPDPFGPPGSRLYRTGDLARWRRDGTLEFVGRRDGQVKIRGFRVELGEVEAALSAVPGVAACAAAVRGGGDAKRLVAWFVPEAGREARLDATTLAARLAARLPGPMVPTSFVPVDRLPLSPNGKVDRAALVEPERSAEEAAGGPPSTLVEQLVGELWSELLAVPRVGVRDHFFQLGGHSLAATRLVTRLRDALDCEVPLALVFERPVLGDLAAALEALLAADEEESALALSLPPEGAAPAAGREALGR